MESYSLESLSKVFVAHAEGAEKQRLDMIDRWRNEWSSDKLPEHLEHTFNLPAALLFMVQEGDSLKRENERLRNRLDAIEKSFTRMR